MKKLNVFIKEFDEYSQPLARCFNLCILDELEKFKKTYEIFLN
jgi:hypothetical protein